jgi:murein DD-endopeptidase MepM/ murein hydrolase activator NlpD
VKGYDIHAPKGHEAGVLNEIAANGDFVILKATEGQGFKDPATAEFTQYFRNTRLKIGFYHFAWPANAPEADAANFLSVVKKLGKSGDDVALDFEPYNAAGVGTVPKNFPTWICTWLDIVDAELGSKTGIYLNDDMANKVVFHSSQEQLNRIRKAPLWKAKYASEPGSLYGWDHYFMWQWNSTHIDKNIIQPQYEHEWDETAIGSKGVQVTGIVVGAEDPTDSAYVPVKRSFVKSDGGLYVVADLPKPPDPPAGIGPGDVWIELLKFGTTDSDSVRRMQRQLKIAQTGNYDAETDAAVRAWQASIGNTPDPEGQSSIGPAQAKRLFEGSGDTLKEGTSPPKPPGGKVSKVFADRIQPGVTDSDSVRAVQTALNAVSFPPHTNIPVSGNMDDTTMNCMGDFQAFIGNSVDRLLGPKQCAKLFEMAGMPLEWHDEPSGGGGGGGGGTIDTPYPGATVSYAFGVRNSRYAAGFHTGRDYGCGVGTPLRATWTCTVVATNAWGAAYGNHVIMQHGDRRIAYCHMSRIDVRVGQQLTPGSNVGLSGATGNVSGAHVHVEERTAPYGYNNVVHNPTL